MAEGSQKEVKAKPEHNSLMVLPPGVEVSAVGMKIAGNLSYQQWHDMMERLQAVHHSILWVIGDGLAYGEAWFGEEFSQAIAEYSKQTVYNAMSVAKRVPIYRRTVNLSFSHHAEVAALSADKQVEYLKLAAERRLKVSELRQLIRTKEEPEPRLDWHEPVEAPPVVPEDPEFDAMSDVKPSRFYPEIPETISDGLPPPRPMNLEVQYNRIVGIVRQFRAAEKQDNDGEANRQRTAMDFFLAELDRREERAAR